MSVWPSVGMKCVLVDFSADAFGNDWSHLRAKIFTISALKNFSNGALVCQIMEWPINASRDRWTRVNRFRPLVTKTAEEDAAMIRHLVDEMDVMSRADRYLELLNQD